jgi:hypothetical protein
LFGRGPDYTERRKATMLGMNLSELFMIALLVVPWIVLMLGFIALTGYIVYLLVRDSFDHGFHLHHRKAH